MSTQAQKGITFNGVTVLGVGVRPITRKGNLATETLGYGLALLTEKENGRRSYRTLADMLKGCRDITGAAFEKYTAEAFTEARALNLAAEFSKATGVPLQDEERAKIEELKNKVEEMNAKKVNGEEGKKGEGKKEKKAKKTTAERIADIVNAIGGTTQARATPLIDALATLDPLAAAAAKCAIEGGTPEEVAALLENARREKAESATLATRK